MVVALGFQGSVIAILVLYLLFWLKLDLITMLPILAGLLLVALVFGYNALSSHSTGLTKTL